MQFEALVVRNIDLLSVLIEVAKKSLVLLKIGPAHAKFAEQVERKLIMTLLSEERAS